MATFGSAFGQYGITSLLREGQASERRKRFWSVNWSRSLGSLLVRRVGYPLDVIIRQRARAMLPYLQMRPHERLLNVACGVGYFAFELGARYPIRIDAVDHDPEVIGMACRIARQTGLTNVSFEVADRSHLRFLAESYDKVLVSQALQPVALTEAFLGEMNRVLVQGGLLVLAVRLNTGGATRSGGQEAMLRQSLSAAGFEWLESKRIIKRFSCWGHKLGQVGFPVAYWLSLLDDHCTGGKELVIKACKVQRYSYHGSYHSRDDQAERRVR